MKSSLEYKIAIGFAAFLLMVAMLGIVSYQSIHRFIASTHQDDHTRRVITKIAETSGEILSAESAVRAYLISGDADWAGQWRAARDRIAPKVKSLRTLTENNPEQQERLDRLDGLLADKLALMQQMVELRRDRGLEAVRQHMRTGESKAKMEGISAVLAETMTAEEQLLQSSIAAEQASGSRMIVVICSGSILALLAVILAGWMIQRDITARRRAEQTLRDAQERFRAMIDAVQDYAIYTLDPQGYLTSWNRGAERIKGYESEEVLGRHFSIFHTQEDIAQDLPASQLRIAAEEGRYEEEAWRVRKDGSKFWASVVISAVKDEKGNLRGFTKVTRDVTERMRAEKDIRNLNKALERHSAQLEAANQELEAFSYSVSHDLRAPLRSIDGFSQALLEDYGDKLDEGGHDSLRRVRGATQRMGQLIDDLLNLSRVTRSEMRHVTVDLSEMVREVAADLQKSQPERTVSLIVDDGLTAEGDPHLLRVVMDNLIGNAWKFTSKRNDAVIEFGLRSDGVFFVRDNGVGFDMKYAEKLFGAFQRLHGMNEFAGTGIGLATVQRIIHRHGGRVWAEGEVNKGATFYFAVTADAAAARQAA